MSPGIPWRGLTPEREQEIRRVTIGPYYDALTVHRGILRDLLAEIDRLRAELAETIRHRDAWVATARKLDPEVMPDELNWMGSAPWPA